MPSTILDLASTATTLLNKKRMRLKTWVRPNLRLPSLVVPHQRSDADQALYDACRWDVKRFAEAFFPHLCTLPFSSMHEDFFAQYAADQDRRGLKDATAAPRGNAKTSIKGFIKPIHDCVYQHERYILIVSNPATLAIDKVKQIRDELEFNATLQRVYGPQVGDLWNQDDCITAGGVRVRAASPQSQIRGLVWIDAVHQIATRPTKMLFDDIEDSEAVLSQTQRAKFASRYNADFMKLGTTATNVEVIGTILHPDALLATMFDNSGYRHHFYQAVIRFPDESMLWHQWRAIFTDLSNPTHQEDARAFFEAHEAQMLAGSAVLWPEKESYYDLMVMRVVEGDSAFYLEKQNEPMADNRYIFDMDAAAYCTLQPNGILRADGRLVPWLDLTQVAAFYDPALGKAKDCAACAIVGRDTAGYEYVLDAYCTNTDSPDDQCTAIVDMLYQWQCELLGIEVNGFQSLLPKNIREAVAKKAQAEGHRWHVQIAPITHVRNKVLRIKSLEPLVKNGWLVFACTLPAEAMRQLREFIPVPDVGRDDFPDSLEGALETVRGKWKKTDAA